jgi:hypothetical protein
MNMASENIKWSAGKGMFACVILFVGNNKNSILKITGMPRGGEDIRCGVSQT